MAHYMEVHEAGNTFLELLRTQLYPEILESPEHIDLRHPTQAEGLLLGVHLYDIQENGENRQTDMQPSDLTHQRFPPLSLTLNYMITAYTTPQLLIPHIMGILYDHPVLKPSAEAEEIYIHLLNLTTDEKMRLWNYPDLPYHLSLFYSLSPVFLNSSRLIKISRVVSTEFTVKDKSQ